MRAFDVYCVPGEHGYTSTEAFQILWYIQEEQGIPTSRTKATRLRKAEDALREVGIDPASVIVNDWPAL